MRTLLSRVLMALAVIAPFGEGRAEVATPELIQCAPYARERSGINLFGDASIWWEQSVGVYTRSRMPKPGAVLLLHQYSQSGRAHAAVVTRIVSAREIRIDHANWMNDGAIYRNNPVVDVSPENNWSQVRVWNIQAGNWGGKTYRVRGFIAHTGVKPARTEAAYATPDDDARNPRADSGFALTEEDLGIPFQGGPS